MGTKKSLNLTELFYKKSETRTRAEITSEIDSTIRSHEVIAGKEEKANKTTSWGNPLSDVKYPSEKLAKTELDTKASTTQLNTAKSELEDAIDTVSGTVTSEVSRIDTALNGKVDKVSGKGLSSADFTQAEKTKLANIQVEANKIIVDTSMNPNSTNPVQNAVICANFMTYQGVVDLLNNIQTGHGKLLSVSIDSNGDLIVDDDGFEYYTSDEVDDGFTVNVEKQTNAESGYLSTYVVKQGGSQVGVKINIPKDFLVMSASLKTAASGDLSTLGSGFSVGDKYIDWVINSKDATGTSGAEHLYLNVKDLVDAYSADESTLTKNGSNVFSIKNGGVSTSKLDSTLQSAISSIDGKVDKVTGKGLSTNDFTTSYKGQLDSLDTNLNGKVDKETGKGLSSNDFTDSYKGQLDGLSTALSGKVDKETGKGLSTNDYTNADKTKVDEIDDKVDKVTGKDLSTNDFTTSYKNQLDGLDTALAGKVNANQGSSNSGKYLRVDTDGEVICATAPSGGGGGSSNFSGDYLDLVNTPDIPDKTSDLTNDGDGTNPFLTIVDLDSVELLVTFTDDTTLSLNLFKELTVNNGGS